MAEIEARIMKESGRFTKEHTIKGIANERRSGPVEKSKILFKLPIIAVTVRLCYETEKSKCNLPLDKNRSSCKTQTAFKHKTVASKRFHKLKTILKLAN